MDDNSKQVCTNCKYFKRYYILGCDYRLKVTNEGFCSCAEIRGKTKYTKKNLGCDLWQPYELEKLKIHFRTEQRLEQISKDIQDILTILRDID